MFDIFYLDKKPGISSREKFAKSIEHAREQSRTRYFWIVNYLCDYSEWDFLWEPPPWENQFIHAWPSQWQKDSGTYLLPKNFSDQIKYHCSPQIPRLECKENWSHTDLNFDYSWHPDSTDDAYIYQFGTQHQKTGGPQYLVTGATKIKYVSHPVLEKTSVDPHWKIPNTIDKDKFDWTWHPDDLDKPYIYQFGTQHQPTGGPVYIVPGAEKVKYVTSPVAIKVVVDEYWHIPENIDATKFDWTWHPDSNEEPYIYQFGTQHQPTGGPRYTVPGASKIKYISHPRAEKTSVDDCWQVPAQVDKSLFDFTWHPSSLEEPYCYEFGTQHQKTGGPVYVMPNATKTKYVSDLSAVKITVDEHWQIPKGIDIEKFDWTWHPENTDVPYIYQFGTQHQKTGGPTYRMPGATKIKYVNHPRAVKISKDKNWQVPEGIDKTQFDWTWHPDATDDAFIYQFGTQHQCTGGPKYIVPGANIVKYISSQHAIKTSVDDHWSTDDSVEFEEFDWTWHPEDVVNPFIYQFGTQHQKTGGPRYTVPGASKVFYVEAPRVTKINRDSNWRIPDKINVDNFDFTWHPDSTDDPFIYQFGTQHQRTHGPQYVVDGAKQIKYVTSVRSIKDTIDSNWDNIEQWQDSNFDFSWHPENLEKPFVYQFGTQWQKTGGPVYRMPGATETKYIPHPRHTKKTVDDYWEVPENVNTDNFDFTWHPDETAPPYIYQFGTQWQKTGGPRYVVPGATVVKYIQKPRCEKVNIDDCWEIPSGVEFDDFDYTWHPDATEKPYIYQFGTQWQKTGGPRYCVENAREVKYVDQVRIKTQRFATGAIVIDHLDGYTEKVVKEISPSISVLKTVRYVSNYLDTLKRVIKNITDCEYVWIVSSVCDYTNFDFSWHPETWQSTMLHVFASEDQKFGDTFFVHVPTFNSRIDDAELLEWYDCNFVEDISVPRHPLPMLTHEYDTHVECIPELNFKSPLILLSTKDKDVVYPTVNLWRAQTKTIVPLNEGATSVILPREAVPFIKKQFYDYPYIDKTHKVNSEDCLDIVFIANGESNAEQNWKHLQNCIKGLPNRVVRIDGVNGRAEAYRAAMNASETNWAFCVFAKLEVNPEFDWNWQPDRLQNPKHYIFHAENPVNGLVYGHMAMIAYNKKLVLNTQPRGLDFTLDSDHEVVPISSGVARYADDPWTAWRSAFRECIKLYHSLPDIDNEWRLQQWLKINLQGDAIGDWSIRGAEDAIDYYDSVQGSFDALRLTYEWDWLEQYFTQRYNQSPNQLCTQFLNQ